MRFTLVSDGSSDQALIPILVWSLRDAGVASDLQPRWAEFRHLLKPPVGLVEKISKAIDLYPADLLFVHRDSENQLPASRKEEIEAALAKVRERGMNIPHVCVIPVRMLEAWLLFNEPAIRKAAGNPNGTVRLELPRARDVENMPDPKEQLFELIKTASELTGRRLRKLSVSQARYRISEIVDDFSSLRLLEAFRAFEADLRAIVNDGNRLGGQQS